MIKFPHCPEEIEEELAKSVAAFVDGKYALFQTRFECEFNCVDKLAMVVRPHVCAMVSDIIFVDKYLFEPGPGPFRFEKFIGKYTGIEFLGPIRHLVTEITQYIVKEWKSKCPRQ